MVTDRRTQNRPGAVDRRGANRVTVNSTNPKWDRREVTTELQPYGEIVKVFHRILMDKGRISTAIYLTSRVFGRTFLKHESSMHHSDLEMYSIRVGSVDGMSIGYLFRSPLAIKNDPYFIMFYRRGTNSVEDIIKGPVPAEKKYVFSDLVIHSHNSGYLITRLEDNSVTRMLAG